jgi:peptide/nickel transport system substrate-binding protein
MNLSLGLETLDPVLSNSPQSIWVLTSMMDGLVIYDKENKIIPQLAKSWRISENGLIYTFFLRKDIKFHDDECFIKTNGRGRNVNSYDVKYCFERLNDPTTKTRGLWLLRDKVKGVTEYADYKSGKLKSEINEISGIKILNDSTLSIELTTPFAPFLSLLTMSYAYIYPKEAVEYYGNNFNFHPVGTGAFRFVKWELDKELILEKNLNYFEKDSAGNSIPYIEKVKFSYTQSRETEFLDYLNNKYDYHEPTAEVLDALTDDKGKLINEDKKDFKLFRQPWLNTVYLIMVQNRNLPAGAKSPFVDNKKLRQAINYAIDREKITKYVLKNRGIPAHHGPLPPGIPGYNDTIKGYLYDREKALLLLDEAGYPQGKGLDLTLVISNDELQRSIGIAIQEQLKEIGMNIKIEQLLQASLNTKQQDGEFEFTRGNWGADYFDPENFMALFYSKNIIPNGPNKTGYSNPEVDKLYEKSIKITDFEERKKIYNEMERIVIDDAAWVFLFYNERVYLLQNNISGFYLDGLNNIVLKYTRKK